MPKPLGRTIRRFLFFGIPLEQLMMIEVVSLIIIQCLVAPCSVAVFWLLPLIFGLPAIHSLITGISLKNKKIIILSIVSGLMSLFWLAALIAYGFLLQFNNQLGGQ